MWVVIVIHQWLERKRLWRLFRDGGSEDPSESLLLFMMKMKRIAIKI